MLISISALQAGEKKSAFPEFGFPSIPWHRRQSFGSWCTHTQGYLVLGCTKKCLQERSRSHLGWASVRWLPQQIPKQATTTGAQHNFRRRHPASIFLEWRNAAWSSFSSSSSWILLVFVLVGGCAPTPRVLLFLALHSACRAEFPV